MHGVPAHDSIDHALAPPHITVHDCQIALSHLASSEQSCQISMRWIIFGHHDHPRGILVQPMHDPWTLNAADARELSAVG
jgi:hypothetical protein